ncbi:MAG: hypothetical protein VB997_10200, partial [Opitutales bacterium]
MKSHLIWMGFALTAALSFAADEKVVIAQARGCLRCHQGIEDIREPGSPMMIVIRAMGIAYGDAAGCVVCHGGTPSASTKEEAHSGSPAALQVNGPTEFYPHPGSLLVSQR